ncbi:hypothetical protein [Pedobacter caeni]|uniref:Uncharacterized protein n=1 Tax=Pedobacter caeni TaxID=288992 RepID=A0A1M5GWU5_9SPHI|nr:hypothetical protein [Pedobacter caeni]SHG08158.1 hypothetical protein SAMN04488522_104402 [Pedobacter caeni]
MGAEINNYFQVEARFRGSNHVEMKINPAKAQWSLAQIKSLFYLDDVIAFTANYGGTMYHGFWGTCIVGGQNEKMHRTNRIVDVYGSTLGQSKRTFNDSGLNTLGWTKEPYITNFRIQQVTGDIFFRSSYFSNSQLSWQYKIGNGVWSQGFPISSLAKNSEGDFNFTTTEFMEAGREVRIRGVITNEEGVYNGPETYFLVRVRKIVLSRGDFASQAAANYGVNNATYTTDRGSFGMYARLFSNDPEILNDGVDAGAVYYSDGASWYDVQYVAERDRNEIVSMGSIQQSGPFANQWPPTDPAYESLLTEGWSLSYWFGSSNQDACNSVANNTNQITPYRVLTTKKEILFTDASKENIIPVGWYADSGGSTWFIADGVKVMQGFQCAI